MPADPAPPGAAQAVPPDFRTIDIRTRQGDREIAFLLRLDLRDRTQYDIAMAVGIGRVLFEHETSLAVATILSKGDVFVDIGANVGWFSQLAAGIVGPSGRVAAFEPNPANIAAFNANMAMNGNPAHVLLSGKALSDRSGPVDFVVFDETAGPNAPFARDSNGMLWTSDHDGGAGIRRIAVEAMPLDRALAELRLPMPKAVKIDTEGAEERILRGAGALIDPARIPFIVCEVNGNGLRQHGTSPAGLRAFMSARGYAAFLLRRDGTLPLLVPDGTDIGSQYVFNVLFSTPDHVARAWPRVGFVSVLEELQQQKRS